MFLFCSSVDEIILSYVVTVLENLASEISMGPLEDVFDVEEFCEMLTAYFPEFSSIPHAVVSQWVFDLVDSIRKSNNKGMFMFYTMEIETMEH